MGSAAPQGGTTEPWEIGTPWEIALHGLTPSECDYIQQRLTERFHDAHSLIFHPGEQSSALYIVKRGELRIYYLNEAGKEFTLMLCPAGHMIGLLSCLLNRERFIFADSKFPAVLNVLPRDGLLEIMESIPRFSRNIALIAARMAVHHLSNYGVFAIESSSVRLINILIRMAAPRGGGETENDPRAPYVVSGLTQTELASLVGVSRTWVNQLLADFEKQGLIQRQKQVIVIPDINDLVRKKIEFKISGKETGRPPS